MADDPQDTKPEAPKPYEDEAQENAYQGFKGFMERFEAEKAAATVEPPKRTNADKPWSGFASLFGG